MEFKYTKGHVEQILETYPYIREGMGYPPRGDPVLYVGDDTPKRDFYDKQHASTVRDGKKRARASEDTICAVFDIECAFPRLSEESRVLLSYVYIYGFSHAETASKVGLSENSVKLRTQAALDELCRVLNGG